MSTETQPDHYEAKVDFTAIYDQPDPRAYYRTLSALDYSIPAHGAAVFECLLGELGSREEQTILDVCCSYGINAALLNHDLELDDLTTRYASVDSSLGGDQLAALDRRWYAQRSRDDAVSTIGLDVAGNALRYATAAGLLDQSLQVDLEAGPCDEETRTLLASADLVTITGGIGYVGERTFGTIVEASGDDPPWIAALNLRWVDFTPIAERLEALGLVTERLDSYSVPQRRFADAEEREAALAALAARGLDASDEHRADAHFAELFVARPPEAVRDAPIEGILGHLTGE